MRKSGLCPPFIHSVRAAEEGMHRPSVEGGGRCQTPACNYNRGPDPATSQHEGLSLASHSEVLQEIWKEREVSHEKMP